MGVHLYTNGAWTNSGKIYRNSNNLFNISAFINGIVMTRGTYTYNADTNTLTITATGNDAHTGNGNTYHVSVEGGNDYTISWNTNTSVGGYVYVFENGLTDASHTHSWNSLSLGGNITAQNDTTFLILRLGCELSDTTKWYSNLMINEGSTALPYEPYNVVDWYTNQGHGYSSGAWS